MCPKCIDLDASKNRGKPPQNGWFILENPMNKWMIWGGFPCFSHIIGSTPIFVGQATILPMPSFHRPAAARSSELLPMPLSPAKVMGI